MIDTSPYLNYEGPMPVSHGPYPEADFNTEVTHSGRIVERTLGDAMYDEGLDLSNEELQRLYQLERNLNNIDNSLRFYTLSGEGGVAVAGLYWAVQDAQREIVDFDKHPDFRDEFKHEVDLIISRENDEYDRMREEEEMARRQSLSTRPVLLAYPVTVLGDEDVVF